MQPKFVGLKFAHKWHDLGTQYQQYDNTRTAINAAIDNGHEIDCWEKCAAFRAGKNGLPFEVKTWMRYGPIPVGPDGYAERSCNHANNEPEYGVSVADDDWLNSLRGQISHNRRNQKPVYFAGLQVGYGSDGEPVILPVKEA